MPGGHNFRTGETAFGGKNAAMGEQRKELVIFPLKATVLF